MNDDPAPPGRGAPEFVNASDHGPVAPAVLDRLARTLGTGGPATVQRIILLYLRDTPERFAQLRAAVELGDADALASAAHGMKSSSASVGAVQFASMCAALEARGRGGVLDGAMREVDAANIEFERVHATLRERLERS